jgi:hypothetical protein
MVLILSFPIFASGYMINSAAAHYGNDNVWISDQNALTIEITVNDPDGLHYIVVVRWPGGGVCFDAGNLCPGPGNCPLTTFKIRLPIGHWGHDHRIYVVDCQEPAASGGIWDWPTFGDPKRATEVGGIDVPVNKFPLLALLFVPYVPYIGLASAILVATATTALYVKRVKRKKEKQ